MDAKVWKVPKSNGNGFWEVKESEKYGLSCNCPIWIYNRNGNRTCKHTQFVQESKLEATASS